MMVIIWTLLIAGILLGSINQVAAFLCLAGFLLWGVNHLFPMFSEARKLRQAVDKLTVGLISQAPTVTLTAN